MLCYQHALAQNIDLEKIEFRGLGFCSSEEMIIENLGDPEKVFEPDYECGYLSAEEQNKKIYTLDYKDFRFTGNNTENYVIDEICFNNEAVVLNYLNYQIDSGTTIHKLAEIFGQSSFPNLRSDSGVVIIPNKDRNEEDGFEFEFKNGKLVCMRYWSPC